MNENHERAIFVVIEPDPLKRADADRIQQDDPLQLLFFESSAHARAFIERMPLNPGIRLEVREDSRSGMKSARAPRW